MNERELWWKMLIVGAACAIGYSVAFPLGEKIKFGIDLYGGYSLLYEIDDTGLDPDEKADLAKQVMNVLQERVDPDGVMNLVWRPVGTNRLEIQMPRPSDAVLAQRQEYDALRDKLRDSNLKRGEVLRALALPAGDREAALDGLVRGVESRRPLLGALPPLFDEVSAARAEKDDEKLYAAQEKLDEQLAKVLASNVDLGRLQTAIEAGPRSAFRREELTKILAATPDQAPLIQSVVDAFDRWRTRRGREGTLDDPADLQRLLRGAGVLEFRMLAEADPADPGKFDVYREALRQHGPRPRPGEETFRWFEIEKPREFFRQFPDFERDFDAFKLRQRIIVDRFGDEYYILAYVTPNKGLTHAAGELDWTLKRAGATRDDQGRPAVSFELDERGGARFDTLTRQNKNKLMCIFLDDHAVSYAEIQAVIRTRGIIHGSFTPKEVQELVKKLNAGSLPRKLKEPPISVRAVGPSLGESNRAAGLRSAKYGAIAVAVFMIGYYLYSGIIAVFAVAMNTLLMMGVLGMFGATLTLPGVAGIVLSIGMAVDANVLIYERIREEMLRGTGLRMAIRLGYERALSAIIDSNLTTLITSVILYLIASEEIKGFGLTLGSGVVLNMFTAVFVTRILFEFMAMPRVPRDLTTYVLIATGAFLAIGGAFWGGGYVLTDPEARATSLAIALGKLLVFIGGATGGFLALAWIARLLHWNIQGEKMPMLRLIGVPRINWYGKRHAFYVLSIVLTVGGLLLFFSRDARKLYDIEFLGGTAAQIDLKQPGSIGEPQIAERLLRAADELRGFAERLPGATITQQGNEFALSTPGVPASRLREFVQDVLGDWLAPAGLREAGAEQLALLTKPELNVTIDGDTAAENDPARLGLRGGLRLVADRLRLWAEALADAQIQAVESLEPGAPAGASFEIVSRVTSKEVVVSSLLSVMRDDAGRELLDIAPALDFTFLKNDRLGGVDYFPIRERDLAAVTGNPALVADVTEWRGGVAIILEDMNPPQDPEALRKRLKAMRLQPGFEQYGWRDSEVIGLTPAASDSGVFTRVAVVVTDENFPYEETSESSAAWQANLAEPEVRLVREALERQTSLSKITQFAPQVAQEAKTKAYIALALSWLGIILYVWFRFGSATWGLAAVVALVHDVLVVLGLVASAWFIGQTAFGRALLIEGFRIDLAMVAALLTVIGYSVNDSIVVFDRIRENRGKLGVVRPELISDSINQTLARTLLTGLTTMLVILIMYIVGGRGIHGFMYAMLIGIITGTYSSVFVASPLLVALQKRVAAGR